MTTPTYKTCAAAGCKDPTVPKPPGAGRPPKYCLRHQKHKDRTRRRLKEEGLIPISPSTDEFKARKLALFLGLANGDEKAALAMAKRHDIGPEHLARAQEVDLKGLRDRTPGALGDIFSVGAAIGALTGIENLSAFEPSETLRFISETTKGSEQFGAHGGRTTYPVINVIFPE